MFNIGLHVGRNVLLKTYCQVGCHIVDVIHFVSVCRYFIDLLQTMP